MSETKPSMAPQGPSPLVEADPDSINSPLISERIDRIFNKNPIEKDADGNYVLTDAEIRAMASYFREQRQNFLRNEETKIAEGPRRRTPKALPGPKPSAAPLAPAAPSRSAEDIF